MTAAAPERGPDVGGRAADALRGRMLRGSAWVLAGKVAGAVLALAVNAILARLLTGAELGIYFLLFATVVFAATLAEVGLDRAIVRFVSASLGVGDGGRARAAIRSSFRIAALAALVGGGLLVLVAGRLVAESVGGPPSTDTAVVLAGGWLVVLAFQTMVAETFRGFQHFRYATLFDGVLANALVVAVLGGLWIAGASLSLPGAVLITAGAVGASLLLSGALLARRTATLPAGGHVPLGELMGVAWPLWVVNAAAFLLGTGADLWIVGLLEGSTDVAVYGAAARLVLFVAMPLIIVSQVAPPIVAQMHAQGRRAQLEGALRDLATLSSLPSSAVLLVFIVAGGPLLGVIFGEGFRDGAAVLAVLCCARLVAVATGSCGVVLMMTGHQRAMMMLTLACGALSVGLGVALGWAFGIVGVAIGTATGQSAQNLAQLALARRRVGIWTHARLSLAPVRGLRAGSPP